MTQFECSFRWPYHHGKVEWHHPISWDPKVGAYLCELHHSLIQGRKKVHDLELADPVGLEQMRNKVVKYIQGVVKDAGYSKYDIDKN